LSAGEDFTSYDSSMVKV